MFGSIAPSRLGLAAVVGLLTAWTALPLAAVEPAAEGVLVLRNGNVLAGVVRQSGDYFRVEAAGAVLQVPAAQIEMRCRSLDEAYEMRRQARGGSTADTHVELARWCLRQDLLDQAARELLDARTLDPSHPALASLELQLEQIVQIKVQRQSAAAPAPTALGPGADRKSTKTESPAFDVSTEARTQFVRSIQPMLIHTCATGGCHQPGSARRLQLNRWALDGNGNVTFVRRNLAAVVEQIQKDDPTASPLLHYARQEHGGSPGAFSKPLEPFQQTMLVDWMNAAAGFQPPEPVEAVQAVEGGASSAAAPVRVEPVVLEAPLPAALKPVVGAATKQIAPLTPRDPFDPEIFNRRVAARAVVTEPAAETAESAAPP